MPNFVIVLLSSLLVPSILALEYNNRNICDGPYALCAFAYCTTIPNNTTHVSCSCAGPFNGINSGPTSCKSRTETFTSTFSLLNSFAPDPTSQFPVLSVEKTAPTIYAFPCTGSNAAPWAQCDGLPCVISPGAVTCDYPLKPASDNFYYGTECPKTKERQRELCLSLRSAAVIPDGANATTLPEALINATLGPLYGVPPRIESCVL